MDAFCKAVFFLCAFTFYFSIFLTNAFFKANTSCVKSLFRLAQHSKCSHLMYQ
uniref:Uncharacterized protein n=1 Tax=Arundo donax TaxID=35708 RepID=A0A0A9H2N1_ARUDO